MEVVITTKPPTAAKPPENRSSAADKSGDWRNKRDKNEDDPKAGEKDKRVGFANPEASNISEKEESDSDEEEAPAKSRKVVGISDETSDEEEESPKPVPTPSIPKPKFTPTDGRFLKPDELKRRLQKERAYTLVPALNDPKMVSKLVDQAKSKVLEGITVEMMTSMNNEFAKKLRETTFKTRKPATTRQPSQAFSQEVEEIFEDHERLGIDAISLDDLPPVSSFFMSMESDAEMGIEPGCIVGTDIVLNYYSSLGPGESAKPIYGSLESAALRVLYPVINGVEKVECLADSGSQIVSMAKSIAQRFGIAWDPDIRIVMQSANGQLKRTEGIARNVGFNFGGLTIYLQVHIIDGPAYDVLLGRPFDILTESEVKNSASGAQTITITDPIQKRKLTLPTFPRGRNPYTAVKKTEGGSGPYTEKSKTAEPVSDVSDFHHSSRN